MADIRGDWASVMFDDAYAHMELSAIPAEVTTQEVDVIVSLLGLGPDQAVLDLACGLGRHSIELARRGLGPVTGLDFAKSYLDQARDKAHAANVSVQFVHGDMRTLSFKAEFDAVFNCFNSLFYWDDETHCAILSGIHSSLRQDGRLYIGCYNRDYFVGLEALKAHPLLRRITHIRNIVRASRQHLTRYTAAKFTKTREFNAITGELIGHRLLKEKNGETREDHYRIRLYTLTELRQLLEKANFEVENVVGAYGHTFSLFTERFIIIARAR